MTWGKLGLGTVQFGLDYGISNRDGKTPEEEVKKILDMAANAGIIYLDTAALYGNSEEVLGRSFPHPHSFRVVTKTPTITAQPVTEADAEKLEANFLQSLYKLGLPNLYGLLVHHANDLLVPGGEHLIARMQELKARGLLTKIGVSVYTADEIDQVMAQYADSLDLLQLPINIFDQRLLQSRHLKYLKSLGIEIHARSIFLQGLLLMEPEQLSAHFAKIIPLFRDYRLTLANYGISPLQAALGFVIGLEEVDVVLCGVNNATQLHEILALNPVLPPGFDFDKFALSDPEILNPAKWA